MEKLSFKPPGNLCALAGRLDGMGWFFTDHWLANRLRCPWLAIEIVDMPSKNGGSFQFVKRGSLPGRVSHPIDFLLKRPASWGWFLMIPQRKHQRLCAGSH
jgi:hypothetical protein